MRRDDKGRHFGLEAARSLSGLSNGEKEEAPRTGDSTAACKRVGSEAPVPGFESFSAIHGKLQSLSDPLLYP